LHSTVSVLDIKRTPAPAYDGDDPAGAFALLADGARRGLAGALITIVGIEGGAPRSLGAHMAVLADGTYCGYVSGGCVEAAVAGEALEVLHRGKDAVLRFGLGSPFIDIRLPCGGGIDLHVHVNPAPSLINKTLDALAHRLDFTLELSPSTGTTRLVLEPDPRAVSGWNNDVFCRCYKPKTRLILIGRGLEFEALLRMAQTADYDLAAFSPDKHSIQLAQSINVPVTELAGLTDAPSLPIDRWTAIVFLFHDHDWETILLTQALESEAFYIGALGSRNTHSTRCERLRDRGVPETALARINGPIGLFGPTRDATSLAVSALAQIIEERRAFDVQ